MEALDSGMVGILQVFTHLGSAARWSESSTGGQIADIPIAVYRAAEIEIRTKRRREVKFRSINPESLSALRDRPINPATSLGVAMVQGQETELWCFKSGTWVDTALLAQMRFAACRELTDNTKHGVVRAYRSGLYGTSPTQRVRLWATAIYEDGGSAFESIYCTDAIQKIFESCRYEGQTLGGAASRLENFAGWETGKIVIAPVFD
ncbi:hypothetical protein MMC08_000432 [Hypocenomyce scalaris]|nr:hypothetical protein [Hypocenomyce scalaris]